MTASFSTIAVLNQALETPRTRITGISDDQERRQVEDDREAEHVRRQLQRRAAQHAFADAGRRFPHRCGHGVRGLIGGAVVCGPGRQVQAEAAQQPLK
jgi:hypothetical protein